ncbi:DUF2384 domain-containing protein [Deinococcus sp. Arct2-2]|uniref:antitoxin Xre/MbcA/ParS toxin-binding domain-containing protein n=1 Tax=Deinococcus sp. Arct2-2 TaxID=2568653 RepID=UPI0010A407AA|nr:antitoxin Xre/MbcA/ParS toxin-binding domain-containing protein [Deinococcus sp. Arct2-2]THF70949.1 DUF2384 domain-containing protein [Deinococcus sp. Arct2-2]
MTTQHQPSSRTYTPPQIPSRPAGALTLGLSATSTRDLHEAIGRGLPTQAIKAFAETLQLTLQRMLELLDLNEGTYHANRRQGGVIKSGLVNRHLIDMARATEAARSYFGDLPAAQRWLTTPSATFDGKTPLEYARYPGGTEYVTTILARLEHGVYT